MPSHLRASSTTNWPILRRTIACADRGYPETYQCGSRRHPERWGGRAWKKSEDAQERHWLQVNDIHLADNPAWQVDEEDDDDGNSTPDDYPTIRGYAGRGCLGSGGYQFPGYATAATLFVLECRHA
ncbi:MAG: hypothetical protein ACXVDF_13215 [Ktedonobacterales bacterium]